MAELDPLPGTLGEKNAAHLLRRITFGPSIEDILQFADKSADQALSLLFNEVVAPEPPLDPKTSETWLNPKSSANNSDPEDLIDFYIAWHLEQMRNSGNSIKERITYFFHTHLPTRRTLIQSSEALYYQNQLFRHYAFGNFKELFKKICIDNAMLVYLDGASNESGSPNENFAREMFELYSIGKGPQIGQGNYTNYTEQDIQEATKILTGFTNDDSFTHLDEETQIPIGKLIVEAADGPEIKNLAIRHDAGKKVFSDLFQNREIEPQEVINGYATEESVMLELDELIEMIFDQDETSRFLCRKMYRFFVYHQISDTTEQNVIIPLAQTFKNNNYELQPVLEQLLKSQHFYDIDNQITSDDNIGALIKSPIELILGTLRFFNITITTEPVESLYNTIYKKGIFEFIDKQGLSFYEPFEVAGYPAYHQFPAFNRNWITPYSLAYRYQFAENIINGTNPDGESLGFQLDMLEWVKNPQHVSNPSDANLIVNTLTNYLIPFELSEERANFFLYDIFLDGLYLSAWTTEWNNYLSDPSTYEASIRSRLEILVSALIQSPEFQLF
ncbi:MAG: DUF1800 family protein [Bacteroidales bacterium]|nr:DUF1800 family protein [Bacteroidales bacterium]